MIRHITTIVLTLALLTGVVAADQVRISFMFVHYSVGNQIVHAYCGAGYDRPITDVLDTMTVTYGTDTARIVFRDYHLNYWSSGPMSDTAYDCDAEPRLGGFSYDLRSASYDRTKIWNSWDGVTNQYAGFVKEFFQVPDKENQQFWTMFTQHDLPGISGGTVTEDFDMIMIKNPFICWSYMDQAQADSIRKFYEIVRDSAANHPEIQLCFVFGTPRLLYDTIDDSAQAKITWDLVNWFASDSFFFHSNTGSYKNLWTYDSYRPLCETSPDSINRYCLKTAYSASPGDSHLSPLGGRTAQDSLVSFIRRAAYDILVIKANAVTREDIDQKIKQFREGTATEAEVFELIRRYNEGT